MPLIRPGAMERAPGWLPGLVYGALGAGGALGAYLHHGSILTPPPGPRFAPTPTTAGAVGVMLALLLAALTVASTRWLVVRTRWAAALARTLRGAVVGASPRELRLLAIGGAVAEELLFRAALVPTLGVAASAVMFGALHFSGRATFASWMLWATAMGVLLGLLFVYSGSLLPPLLAHALINHENMRFLCRRAPLGASVLAARPHHPRTRRL